MEAAHPPREVDLRLLRPVSADEGIVHPGQVKQLALRDEIPEWSKTCVRSRTKSERIAGGGRYRRTGARRGVTTCLAAVCSTGAALVGVGLTTRSVTDTTRGA